MNRTFAELPIAVVLSTQSTSATEIAVPPRNGSRPKPSGGHRGDRTLSQV